MPKLQHRLDRLEREILGRPDRSIEPPSVAGRPRPVAIVERIDFLKARANLPRVDDRERQKIQESITQCELALNGKTREEIYQEYAAYLDHHLNVGEWGGESRGRDYLTRMLAECRQKLETCQHN